MNQGKENEKTTKISKTIKVLKEPKISKTIKEPKSSTPKNTPKNVVQDGVSMISHTFYDPVDDLQMNDDSIFINDTIFIDGTMDELPPNTDTEGSLWFKSRTQYDTYFNNIFEGYQKESRGIVCPVFAICAAKSFFDNHDISQKEYDEILEKSVTITAMLGVTKQKIFEELVRNTNLKNEIVKTTIDKINLEEVIPMSTKDFCIVFLKNSKYWIIIGDSRTGTYCIRDCHETYQHNFSDRNHFLKFLTTKYSMNTEFKIDGYVFTEYSNIEYMIILSVFTDTFLEQINTMFKEQITDNETKIENMGQISDDQSFIIGCIEPEPGQESFQYPDQDQYYEDTESNEYDYDTDEYSDDSEENRDYA